MSEQLDRPARPARRPRPAADAGVDPIDYRTPVPASGKTEAPAQSPVSAPVAPRQVTAPAVASSPAAAIAGPAGREQTVQLNSRVSVDVGAIFDAAAAGFPSKRAALEHAIMQTFGR